jgi:hypothetical protein
LQFEKGSKQQIAELQSNSRVGVSKMNMIEAALEL